MEPAEEGDATGRGSYGLNAKDNMGWVGTSLAAEVREAAVAPHSDRARKAVCESRVGW